MAPIFDDPKRGTGWRWRERGSRGIVFSIVTVLWFGILMIDRHRTAPLALGLFAVLSGFLVSAMVQTAQALKPNNLSSRDLRILSNVLEAQQQGWHRLLDKLLAAVFFVFLVVVAPAPSGVEVPWLTIDLALVPAALFALLAASATLSSHGLLQGIRSFQSLRSVAIIAAAEARERESDQKATADCAELQPPVNEACGRKLEITPGPASTDA